ncbi:MAG: MaoC family dehydratase [Actinomycetes bacterium]
MATVVTPQFDSVQVGDVLPAQRFPVQRINLIMYAGASGDFNPIHWNERFAKLVGLPNVIAQGMFTMAEAGRVLTDFAGDPARVVHYGVRFTRPVVVTDDDIGAVVEVSGEVVQKLDDGTVVIELTAVCGDDTVLGKARGIVRLI